MAVKRTMRHRNTAQQEKEVDVGGIKQVLKNQSLEEYAEYATKIYGTDVVENRAVPDYRDGLKPVHRAILWSMYNLNLHHTGPYKKAARVVGEVIGSYHPHGDCLRGNTLVPLLSGKNVTIKELVDGEAKSRWVLAYDESTHELVPAKAHSWRVGKCTRIMYRITMSTGEIIEVTNNHPLYDSRKDSWVRAEDIRIGDELAGGTFSEYKGYKNFRLNRGYKNIVHQLVGNFKFGSCSSGEIYHHIDECTKNNKPINITKLKRGEHAKLHDDYVDGLANGHKTMFSENGKLRKKVREKNKSLIRAVNAQLWLIKAVNAIRTLRESGLDLTPSNYESLRGKIYNLTKLSSLVNRGISFDTLCKIEPNFKMDTSNVVWWKNKSKTKVKRATCEMSYDFGMPDAYASSCSEVLTSIIRSANFTSMAKVSWQTYEISANAFAKGNKNKVSYNKVDFIKNKFNVDSVQAFATKVSGCKFEYCSKY